MRTSSATAFLAEIGDLSRFFRLITSSNLAGSLTVLGVPGSETPPDDSTNAQAFAAKLPQRANLSRGGL
jgi:hypothetical protein